MIIQAQTQCFSLSLCLAYDYSNHCHRHIGVVGVKASANRLWPRFPSLPTMPTNSRSRTSRRRRRRNDDASWRCAAAAAAADSMPPPPPEKVRSFIIIAFVLSSCFGGWILGFLVSGGFCLFESEQQREGSDLQTLLRRFWKVAAPYWSSDDKVQARTQLGAVFLLTLATTGISVGFNFLGRDFYNALASQSLSLILFFLL